MRLPTTNSSREQIGTTFWMALALVCGTQVGGQTQEIPCDLSGYSRDCGIEIDRNGPRLNIQWPFSATDRVKMSLRLERGQPLIEEIGLRRGGALRTIFKDLHPFLFLTVGERVAPPGQPPNHFWQTFFDNPASRPHQTHLAQLELTGARVTSRGQRATVVIDRLTAGNFTGNIEFTFFPNTGLFHVAAVVTTQEDRRAILYDFGLAGDNAGWQRFGWRDTENDFQSAIFDLEATDRPLAVRHRVLAAETDGGSLACFSPPHQYQFPRDLTPNLKYVWFGRKHLGQPVPFGVGIRQEKTGGGNFVPWFNAPPGTRQRLGMFLLLHPGNAREAIDETLRFARADRFHPLEGYLTMTSHWHMAVAIAAMERKEPVVPEFVGIFKDMNVNIVHLAEFHGDGHQKDVTPLRLREMDTMFSECRRLSDDKLLFIPGEEINEYLGLAQPGKHPGHWMSIFPKPVYWFQKRPDGQEFVSEDPKFGKLYRVGSREDMTRLIEAEGGLVWAAHPRIKASSWTPDIFRNEDFYLADSWLGAAWKAMPGDCSDPKLGRRVLDLMDDMANWGQRKYVLGEVDVFKIDHTHELFGHMNINYLKLDKLPRYDDGWQSVLDVLRAGKFFVTTGEVLLPKCTIGGKESGDELTLSSDGTAELRADVIWSFPLAFAEVISGDGERVYRETIDLSETGAFGEQTISKKVNLRGRRWARLEVWDVAVNGAFTQPVWIKN